MDVGVYSSDDKGTTKTKKSPDGGQVIRGDYLWLDKREKKSKIIPYKSILNIPI